MLRVLKRFFAAISATVLLMCAVVPVFGTGDATAAQLVLQYDATSAQGQNLLYAKIAMDAEQYAQVTAMAVYYSLDGDNYEPALDSSQTALTDLGEGGRIADGYYQKLCMVPGDTPLKDFVSGDLTEFWVKVKITGGPLAGFTQPAKLSALDAAVPLPQEYQVQALFPRAYSVVTVVQGSPVFTARKKMTVTKGTTRQELLNQLPQTLAMIQQVTEVSTGGYVGSVTAQCAVSWNVPENLCDLEPGVYTFAVPAPAAPAGTELTIAQDGKLYSFAPVLSEIPLSLVITVQQLLGTGTSSNTAAVSSPGSAPSSSSSTSGTVSAAGDTSSDDTGAGGNRGDAGTPPLESSSQASSLPSSTLPSSALPAEQVQSAAPWQPQAGLVPSQVPIAAQESSVAQESSAAQDSPAAQQASSGTSEAQVIAQSPPKDPEASQSSAVSHQSAVQSVLPQVHGKTRTFPVGLAITGVGLLLATGVGIALWVGRPHKK